MAEDFKLAAESRELLGSANSRRMRLEGRIPANLYGFKKDTVSLTVNADDIDQLIAGGSKVVDITVGGSTDKAIVKELQWDVFATHVKHVDLMRVDPADEVSVEVNTEIRGEAIGLKDGGLLKEHLKRIRVKCASYRVPRTIPVRVGAMKIGSELKVSDLKFPDTVTVETPADSLVVELINSKTTAVADEE